MAISSITASSIRHASGDQSTQNSQRAHKSTAEPTADTLRRANDRAEQQAGSTQVQLSALGQIKSGFAEVQTSSKALSDLTPTASTDDVKKAAANFVSAYNKTNKTVRSATQGDGKQAGVLANDERARAAGNELRRPITEGSNPAALQTVGITQNQEGSLAIDTKALDKALQATPDQVRATLVGIGRQVEQTATRELANNGNIAEPVNAPDNRSRNPETRQNEQQAQAATAQHRVEQQTVQINNTFAGPLTPYKPTTFTG